MTEQAKLTPKQERFCREYLIDLNGTQAAIRAGYSEKTAYSIASEVLKKPEIMMRINELQADRSQRTEITADYVLNGIKEIVERCQQKVPVLDDDGKETGEWKFEANPALKGFELLGKHLKLFTEKIETHDHKYTHVEIVMKDDGQDATVTFAAEAEDSVSKQRH